MTWPDDLLDEVKKRWLAGESAGEISRALMDNSHINLSRNAILGKLDRLGITRPGRIKQPPCPAPPKRISPRTVRPRQTKSPPMEATAELLQLLRAEVRVVREELVPARMPLCLLSELTTHTCRWPIGDPSTNDFRFCGVAEADMTVNKPYCKFHTQMSAGKWLKLDESRS